MLEDIQKYLNVYKFDYVLPGEGKKVKMRPYSAADLKSLLMYTDEDAEEGLDALLDSCIIKEEGTPSVEDLWLCDRFYLLIMLRRITKGTIYRFIYRCGTCNSERIVEMDLKEMKIKKMPKNFNFFVELDENIKVKLRPITRKAIKRGIRKDIDSPDKVADSIIRVYSNCIELIETPEGQYSPSQEEAENFLSTIPEFMFEKIQNWFKSFDFGVEMRTVVFCDYEKCPRYGEKTEEEVPLENFLS